MCITALLATNRSRLWGDVRTRRFCCREHGEVSATAHSKVITCHCQPSYLQPSTYPRDSRTRHCVKGDIVIRVPSKDFWQSACCWCRGQPGVGWQIRSFGLMRKRFHEFLFKHSPSVKMREVTIMITSEARWCLTEILSLTVKKIITFDKIFESQYIWHIIVIFLSGTHFQMLWLFCNVKGTFGCEGSDGCILVSECCKVN